MEKSWLNRKTAFALCLVLFSGFVFLSFRTRSRPNLIVITLDTTRADRIGCYGYRHAETPVIDQIAKSGVVFENAYTVCPVTFPSHTTMFTGLLPREHGIHHNGIGKLDTQIPVLAEMLRSQGYETGAFIGAFVLNQKFGLNRGFDQYDDYTGGEFANGQFHRRRAGHMVMDSALEWLKGRASRPYFCWVHLFDAHAPYRSREELFGQRFAERSYDAGIACCDQQIKRIVDFLDKNHTKNSTLIVIVGDHGEGLGQHHEREHGHMLYNSTLRVPLIMAHPSLCKPGHRVTQAVSLVDLAPTLNECLACQSLTKFSGRSLASMLKGHSMSVRPCFAETDVPFLEHHWAPQRCVMTERWKYIRSPIPEFYELQQDPHELHNVAGQQAATMEQMESLLAELEAGTQEHVAQNVGLSSADRRSLASLGYLGNAGGQQSTGDEINKMSLPDIKDCLKHHEAVEDASHLLDLNRPQDALKILEAVLAEVPDYFPARVFQGEALAKSEKLDEALGIYQELAESAPQRCEVHAKLAQTLGQLGRHDEALDEIQKAVNLADDSAEHRVSLGTIYLELDQQQKALELFDSAIQLDPAGANFEIGKMLAASGDLNGAVNCYKRTLNADPNWIPLYTEIGVLLARQRKFGEAIEFANRAVKASPGDADARYNLGLMLTEQGRLEDAIRPLQEAIRLNPRHSKASTTLKRVRAKILGGNGLSTIVSPE